MESDECWTERPVMPRDLEEEALGNEEVEADESDSGSDMEWELEDLLGDGCCQTGESYAESKGLDDKVVKTVVSAHTSTTRRAQEGCDLETTIQITRAAAGIAEDVDERHDRRSSPHRSGGYDAGNDKRYLDMFESVTKTLLCLTKRTKESECMSEVGQCS